MKTINQAIPASFSPDTAFVITLQTTDDGNDREKETLIPLHFPTISESEFTRRGIPYSALHD